jgi:glycosyltransferase involved in cell wall biosynthesis
VSPRRPIKLIIQIPCFNEEATLPGTIADLPTEIEGVDVIELLVIDDGSTDRTAQVARELGVHHIVSHDVNRGLARGFMTGLEASLRAGADIIVNTDADNQYQGSDIPKLVAPVLDGQADLVVGTRPLSNIETFSPIKKALQHIGTHAVRVLSGTDVRDATSGFRAFSREAALRLQVHGRFTYTLETIIQAGAEGLKLKAVPIGVNPQTRPSRLFKSSFAYVRRSIPTIVRSYARYRPLGFFGWLSAIPGVIGLVLVVRWFILRFVSDNDASRVPSLVGAAVCLLMAGQILALGFIADIQAAHRKTTSDVLVMLRRREFGNGPVSPATPKGHDGDAEDAERQIGDHERSA